MKKREELVSDMNELESQLRSLREELNNLDHENLLSDLKKYLGKCYEEKESFNKETEYRYFKFIFGIEESIPKLMTLSITYWDDKELSTELSYFNIELDSSFHPNSEFSCYEWVEIDEDLFLSHYKIVQDRINFLTFK
jgi:hypothetical protein